MGKRVWLAALLAIATVLPAHATGFSLFASGWNPKDTNNAYGAGAAASFDFGNSGLGLAVRGTYYREANVNNIFDNNTNNSTFGRLQIVPVDALLKWDFNNDGPVDVYVGGGATYYFLSLRHVNGININDEAGWTAMVGLRFGNRRSTSFFVEGDYRAARLTAKNDNAVDNGFVHNARLKLDGPALNAGVNWGF